MKIQEQIVVFLHTELKSRSDTREPTATTTRQKKEWQEWKNTKSQPCGSYFCFPALELDRFSSWFPRYVISTSNISNTDADSFVEDESLKQFSFR